MKRVIGRPGDRIEVVDGHVIKNGKRLPESLSETVDKAVLLTENQSVTSYNTRHEFNVVSYEPLDIVVPADHYFVMGDNRDNSSDSRVWGLVPKELLVGRAEAVLFSVNYNSLRLPNFNLFRVGVKL